LLAGEFVTACLGFLAFGKQASADQIPKRAEFRLAGRLFAMVQSE
jgi:hypothetical protein